MSIYQSKCLIVYSWLFSNNCILCLFIVVLISGKVVARYKSGSGAGSEWGGVIYSPSYFWDGIKSRPSHFPNRLLYLLQGQQVEGRDIWGPLGGRETPWEVGVSVRGGATVFEKNKLTGCFYCCRGVLKWPDGRMYTGMFKNGLEDGLAAIFLCLQINKNKM